MFTHLWHRIFTRLWHRPGTPDRRLSVGRLRLEQLEDRSVPATIYVTTAVDVVNPGDGKQSLREAITRANDRAGADVIVVPAGVFKISSLPGDDANFVGDFDITDTVTIRGTGVGRTVIDGQRLDRVFHGFSSSSIRVVLQGMTIRNGAADVYGGGVLTNNVDLVMRNCAVTGNRAFSAGGGIYSRSSAGAGNVKLIGCTVARNYADMGSGGGIQVEGSAMLTVTGSDIRRNVARSQGGGIWTVAPATLTNSSVTGNSAATNGGGILAYFSLTLTGCTFSGNSAGNDGGGIHVGSATLTGCTVSGNSAGNDAGGIWGLTLTLTGCTVSGNSASVNGGGVRAQGEATLTRSTVSGNTAGVSGGGVFVEGVVSLASCTLSGNTAGAFGGGLEVSVGQGALANCTVDGNRARNGGGVDGRVLYLAGTTVSGNAATLDAGGVGAEEMQLTNCTISGNTAGDQGGGVWAVTADLANCTVVENKAQAGGGLFHESGGVFHVRNTIVALNLAGLDGTDPDASGFFVSGGHNLIGQGFSFVNGVNGNLVGTPFNPLDPQLGPLAYNGGPTKTHKLLGGSLAIDAGDNTNVPATDQRRIARVRDGDGNRTRIVDIGAFEK